MNIKEYLSQMKQKVDFELEKYLPNDSTVLSEAMRYSALSHGKRIRATLLIESAKIFNCDDSIVMPFACAIELLHTFSLIHDDLPAMDDDDYRRGQPTLHKKFGEAIAILAADALFALAYEIMSSKKTREKISNNGAILDCIEKISFAIGANGMCLGQSLDILSEGQKITLDDLKFIHKKKTGALIEASIYSGARLAGAGLKNLSKLENFAYHIGLAFQIKDDILDVSGTKEELGKTPGSDIKKNKITYPSLVGLEKSYALMEKEIKDALGYIEDLGENANTLREIAKYIITRNS